MATVEDVPSSWAVDGVSLQTLAYNIVSWGGSRQAPPPLRGDNAMIPYRRGQKWLKKVPDSRTMTLEMWVIGATTEGVPTNGFQRQLFEANWRRLRDLLWTPYRQLTLSKQIKVDGNVRTVRALAEYAGGLDPEMFGPRRAEFEVDLLLADPFFYGDRRTLGGAVVEGEAPTEKVKVTLAPGQTMTQSNGIWIRNDGNVTLTADCDTGTTSAGHPGMIAHGGSQIWFPLTPGATVTGPGTVTYEPAWL